MQTFQLRPLTGRARRTGRVLVRLFFLLFRCRGEQNLDRPRAHHRQAVRRNDQQQCQEQTAEAGNPHRNRSVAVGRLCGARLHHRPWNRQILSSVQRPSKIFLPSRGHFHTFFSLRRYVAAPDPLTRNARGEWSDMRRFATIPAAQGPGTRRAVPGQDKTTHPILSPNGPDLESRHVALGFAWFSPDCSKPAGRSA